MGILPWKDFGWIDFVTLSSNMVHDFFFFYNEHILFVRSYSARQPDSHDWPTRHRGQQRRRHTLPDSLSDLFPQRQAEHQPDGGGDCLARQIPPGLLFTLSLATLVLGLLFTLSLATFVLGLLFALSLAILVLGLLFTLSLATFVLGLLFTLSLATFVLGLLFTHSLTTLPPGLLFTLSLTTLPPGLLFA